MKKVMEYAGVGAMMAAGMVGAYLYLTKPNNKKKTNKKATQNNKNM